MIWAMVAILLQILQIHNFDSSTSMSIPKYFQCFICFGVIPGFVNYRIWAIYESWVSPVFVAITPLLWLKTNNLMHCLWIRANTGIKWIEWLREWRPDYDIKCRLDWLFHTLSHTLCLICLENASNASNAKLNACSSVILILKLWAFIAVILSQKFFNA